MDNRGNVWAIFGRRGTGKTYEAIDIAEFYRKRKQAPKRTIIFDHTQNDESYPEYEIIDIEQLDRLLPERAKVRVQTKDYQHFFEKCSRIKNAVILIDDGTSLFRNNVPDFVIEFLGLAKNHRLEIIFQMHTIADTAPALLKGCNLFIIKQTNDSLPVKKTCPNSKLIDWLITDCKEENAGYSGNQKFATRLLDINEEEIFIKDLTIQQFEKTFNQSISISNYIDER